MAKALKIVGIVVGVVALAATGIGLAMGAAAGAAAAGATASTFLGMTAATWSSIGAIASVAAGAVGVAGAVFAPKPTFSQAGNPLSFQTNPQSALPYPIGRTRMSGLRIHAETADSPTWKSESKDDVLGFAVLLGAGGPMDQIEGFWADKQGIGFNAAGVANAPWSEWMAQKVSLGLAGASALALTFGGVAMPGWTADHKLSGMAHALWMLRGDPKGEKFGAGVPEPEWIGRWVKVYDPRKDSTYPGGGGSHRALDETTYEWSANPYLHALTWCLGRWQNGKRTLGIGAPIENIRVAEFVEGANVADANGWACGGVEWSTDSKWAILKRMLQAGGGEPTMTGAMIGCRVNMPRVSIATVTGADLLETLSVATTRSRRDRFNTVIPRFRSEDHDWEVISGSPVSVPLYVTEDGGRRTKEIDFPLVQHEVNTNGNKQAGELAAYEIVNSREGGPIRFTTGPKFIGVKTGDVVVLDVPDEGLAAQPVLIRSRSIDPATFKISFTAETETHAKHDFALGRTTTPPPTYSPTPPNLTPPLPNAALWQLTAERTGDVLPALRVRGACEFPGADVVVIEYRKAAALTWQSMGLFDASTPVDHSINAVEAGQSYTARIAYRSGIRQGPWLELAAVTTPAFTLVDTVWELEDAFAARNARNPDPIPAASFATNGTAVDHTAPALVVSNISWQWTWGGDETTLTGWEFEVRPSTSSAAYTPGTDDDTLVVDLPRNRRAFFLLGVPSTLYYTGAVRGYREVDPDIDPSGRLYGPWIKPTLAAEDPYRPMANKAYDGDLSGTIGSVPATIVAAVVDPATGNVNSGKVVTDSIADGAINVAGYVRHTGTIGLGAGEAPYTVPFLGSSFQVAWDGEVVIRLLIPYEITVTDPVEGTEYAVNLYGFIQRTGVGSPMYTDAIPAKEVWNQPTATGDKAFGRRIGVIEHRYTGLVGGTYEVGIYASTTPDAGVTLPPVRYIRVDNPRAAQ